MVQPESFRGNPEAKEQRVEAEVVCFDYGNTLVMDPFEKVVDKTIGSVGVTLRDFGFYFEREKIKRAWTRANSEIDFPYASHFHQEEPIIQGFLQELGVPADIGVLVAPNILADYRFELAKQISSDHQTAQTLKDTFSFLIAKGKRISVLSNDRAYGPRSALAWLGVSDLVSEFITSEELGIEKPNPRVFQETARRLRVRPEQIAYVGDDPIRDVDGAKKAGFKAILFIPSEEFRKQHAWKDYQTQSKIPPDAEIRNLSELKRIIT